MLTSGALDEFCTAIQEMASQGLSPGSSGNFSLRDDNHVWVSRSGCEAQDCSPTDFVEYDLVSNRYHGSQAPSKELPLHLAMYEKNRGAGCIIHLHSPSAMAVSTLKPWSAISAIPPVTPYFVMKVGRAPLIPYFPPGSAQLGEAVAKLPGSFNAFLMQNHGFTVAFSDVDSTRQAAIEMEATCEIWLKVWNMEPRLLSDDEAKYLAEKSGTFWA